MTTDTNRRTMTAIARDAYGGPEVLRTMTIPVPEPADNEVLVEVHASSVNPADWYHVTGTPYLFRLLTGPRKPKHTVPGTDVAGRVELVGRNITSLTPGDEVYGELGHGAYAQFVTAPESALSPKPTNLTFAEAAATPLAGMAALQGLRDSARLEGGQHVLINGASGGVGTFAVQIAKAMGAEVTAVVGTRNVERARSISADHVIDYITTDFTRTERRYDVIFDLVGTRRIKDLLRVLAPKGTLVIASGSGNLWIGPLGRVLTGLIRSVGHQETHRCIRC